MAQASRGLQWVGGAILAGLFVVLAYQSVVRTVDLPVYHRVARELLAGEYRIYPAEVFDAGSLTIPAHGFRYAPAIAFLLIPIGWLPLEVAALLLFAAKLVAVGYIAAVIARRTGLPATARAPFVLALVLVGGYVAEEFRYGNVHFLTIALMVYAFDAGEAGRVGGPAVALGLAIATKLTPAALLGYFVVRRRVAVCVATLGVLAALAAAPALIVGPRANLRLLRAFGVYAAQKVDEQDNYALRGVLLRHLTTTYPADRSHLAANVADLSPAVVDVVWLMGAALLAGLALAVIGPPGGTPAVRLLELSLVITGLVLASPHTQRRYFVSLYVPVAALLAILARRPEPGIRRSIVIGVGAAAAAGTVLPLVFGGRRLALRYEAASPYFFGTLVLFLALLLVTSRLKRRVDQACGTDNA